jgi:hypothetical protein
MRMLKKKQPKIFKYSRIPVRGLKSGYPEYKAWGLINELLLLSACTQQTWSLSGDNYTLFVSDKQGLDLTMFGADTVQLATGRKGCCGCFAPAR